jgi:trigger factor
MGSGNLSDDQPWVKDYIDKMMKDRKYVEDAYGRIQTQKVFEWAETQLKPEEKDISVEEFYKNERRASAPSSLVNLTGLTV